MIARDDAYRTLDSGRFYVMQPDAEWWDRSVWAEASAVPEGFRYASDTNPEWLTVDELRTMADAD
jgi:UDP-N-acetylglucosamine 4,6-dehydratase